MEFPDFLLELLEGFLYEEAKIVRTITNLTEVSNFSQKHEHHLTGIDVRKSFFEMEINNFCQPEPY